MTARIGTGAEVNGSHPASEYQRMRILRAAVKLAAEAVPPGQVSVNEIVRTAGVSRGTFYALFEDREACLRAAVEEGVALAEARAAAGSNESGGTWLSRVRGALSALLELGEEEPELARLCIARAFVDRDGVSRLDEALTSLERAVDQGRSAPGAVREPSELAAPWVLSGALGAVYARLIGDRGGLAGLETGLMGMIVLPYLGGKAARREENRTHQMDSSAGPKRWRRHSELNGNGSRLRMTYRTMRVLEAVGEQRGLSNQEVAKRAGIVDQGQVSKLLARLAGLELVENTGAGQAKGAANAWTLTEHGEMLARAGRRSERAPA